MKRLILRGLAYAAVIAGAVLACIWTTRSEARADGAALPRATITAACGGERQCAAGDAHRRPDRRRIGVTYAVARARRARARKCAPSARSRTTRRASRPSRPRSMAGSSGCSSTPRDSRCRPGSRCSRSTRRCSCRAQEELLLAKRLQHDMPAGSADAQQNASDLARVGAAPARVLGHSGERDRRDRADGRGRTQR